VILQKTYQSPSKEHHAMTANHKSDVILQILSRTNS